MGNTQKSELSFGKHLCLYPSVCLLTLLWSDVTS